MGNEKSKWAPILLLDGDFMPLDGCLMGLVKGGKAKKFFDITVRSDGKQTLSVHLC